MARPRPASEASDWDSIGWRGLAQRCACVFLLWISIVSILCSFLTKVGIHNKIIMKISIEHKNRNGSRGSAAEKLVSGQRFGIENCAR